MSEPIAIGITEVGPRDGLQNEAAHVPTETKVAFVNRLAESGLAEIETSSFVSPKWVPQLADAEAVFSGIERRANVTYSALVPNEAGLARALKARVGKVAVFTAVSEGFCRRNINASFGESLDRIVSIIKTARHEGLPVRAYLSCILECPYDGEMELEQVRVAIERLLELQPTEVSLGDTLGVSTPDRIEALLEAIADVLPASETVLHLHDTNGRAIESVARAVRLGVRRFDTSAGGLGGCPYAPGAQGNLATEQLLAHAEEVGWVTGVDAAVVASARDLLGPMSAS